MWHIYIYYRFKEHPSHLINYNCIQNIIKSIYYTNYNYIWPSYEFYYCMWVLSGLKGIST